ncbi:FecR family protein [Fibrella sp. WM1]|uniref:FecR family protein n=1 Tax=Fibrella musci TaxID=3242485 RepID=UPI003522AF1A
MNTTVSHELLFDYFAGRVTALQRETIADWLRDPANEETFYRCLDEWERRKPQYIANLTDALPTYRAFLEQTQPPAAAVVPEAVAPTAPFQAVRRSWFSRNGLIAASLTLVLLASGWLLRDHLLYQTIQTAYGETRSLQLADGSTVVLNANSSLRVPRFGFGKAIWGEKSRHVQLTGEANFAVVHTPDDQRFVVHTAKGLDVVVLGTEFTVFARPRETKVVLAKGKVLVNYPTSARRTEQLTLKPGDVVALDSGGRLQRATTPKPRDYAAWQRHEFIFNNTSLRDVGQLLTDNYGLQVRIVGDDLARQTITGSFHAENADELLQAISDVLGINVVRHDQQVVLNDNNA